MSEYNEHDGWHWGRKSLDAGKLESFNKFLRNAGYAIERGAHKELAEAAGLTQDMLSDVLRHRHGQKRRHLGNPNHPLPLFSLTLAVVAGKNGKPGIRNDEELDEWFSIWRALDCINENGEAWVKRFLQHLGYLLPISQPALMIKAPIFTITRPKEIQALHELMPTRDKKIDELRMEMRQMHEELLYEVRALRTVEPDTEHHQEAITMDIDSLLIEEELTD